MADDPVEIALAWDGLRPLGPIWEELARRMGASDHPVRRIKVNDLDDQGRRTLASLLRLQRVPDQRTVALDAVKIGSALGLADEAQLRLLVERICGPIGNRAADRAATSQARAALWRRTTERMGMRVPQTLARIRAAGVPDGDVVLHAQVLEMLADCLERLPLEPPVPLPVLAWQISGDPHTLDAETTCGRYLGLAAIEVTSGALDRQELDAVSMRRALRKLGVIADRLSTPTTTFGLRAEPDSPAGRLIELGDHDRMPVHISGALLDQGTPRFTQSRWLCVENPSVIEIAVAEGCRCALVCTSGWPSTEAQRLLEIARDQGIELCYAGDYDSTGLAIAGFMHARYSSTVLMTDSQYLSADLEKAPRWAEKEPVPSTPWNPRLADEINMHRCVVYQEDPDVWRRLLELAAIAP